ncbi:hypothetical protein [Croceicoccus gelatinilyticus]|uniref:hypothetical protein n=1 Tax=Croceicoccus gelatinilyticus TaxID=2835536 RepID=UPI001BD0749A|nr:hypothetical protein [Croceicoccus gelatinilyticus]MBS7671334.1 hypothetical protein [Croceicoccus gelatinilyticus]
MKADKRKLERLKRIERVRSISKHVAATQAAAAEGTLGQLLSLRDRTRTIAGSYDPQGLCVQGGDLRVLGSFLGGMHRLTQQTEDDIVTARSVADARQADLVSAEKRQSVVTDKIDEVVRGLRKEKAEPAPPRRKNWHGS